MFIMLLALTLQAEPAQKPDASLPVSLERIKRELAAPAPIRPDLTVERPVFRVRIRERQAADHLWDDHGVIPAFVRPKMSVTHFDFLMQTTPQDFRSAVLYPCCIELISIVESISKRVSKARRASAEARARRDVQRELQELEARRRKGG